MAVGFSMKQGTKEIRTAADNIQNCLSELIGPHSHKILFMLIPRPIRQFIPLKYWPCKYFGVFFRGRMRIFNSNPEIVGLSSEMNFTQIFVE